MKIVVIGNYPAGLALLEGQLLAEMVKRGHIVTACAPGEEAWVTESLHASGVNYESIPLDRTGINPVKDLLFTLHMAWRLRTMRPDVVFSFTIKPAIYGSIAAALAGIPRRYSMIPGLGYAFTVSDRKSAKRWALRRLVRTLYWLALPRSQVVFFQNPDDYSLFIEWGLVAEPQAVLVNGNGVDTAHYALTPPVTSGPVFLLIARLIADKGIREYVDAARILRARYPQAVFRLVGPYDPNPAAIQPDEVAAWQAQGVIEYLGETTDVRPFIAASSVYVLPSFYREGTPRTVLEAMSMGRPIVTTDAPGCRETVIPGDNGFLVPPRDVPALVAALERFILQPHLIASMGARSRQIAIDRYDVHKVNAVMLAAMNL